MNSKWSQICISYESPIKHVGLQWVSDLACCFPMRHVGLRWSMSVFNESCRSSMMFVGLQWVSDHTCRSPMGVSGRSPILKIFSWTLLNHAYNLIVKLFILYYFENVSVHRILSIFYAPDCCVHSIWLILFLS